MAVNENDGNVMFVYTPPPMNTMASAYCVVMSHGYYDPYTVILMFDNNLISLSDWLSCLFNLSTARLNIYLLPLFVSLFLLSLKLLYLFILILAVTKIKSVLLTIITLLLFKYLVVGVKGVGQIILLEVLNRIANKR